MSLQGFFFTTEQESGYHNCMTPRFLYYKWYILHTFTSYPKTKTGIFGNPPELRPKSDWSANNYASRREQWIQIRISQLFTMFALGAVIGLEFYTMTSITCFVSTLK